MTGPKRRPLPQPPAPPRAARSQGRALPKALDPCSWSGALALMCIVAAVLWVVEIVNLTDDYGLDRFGVRPRAVDGLWGIVTQPFLHASVQHMASNTLPVILIGWVVMLAGLRHWLVVTAAIVVVGGLLTWAIGPADTVIVGASGMVFGWMGYLLARAIFSRRLKWILVAAAVLFFYGTLLGGLVPSLNSDISWQAHVGGFAAGVLTGAALHPRGRDSRLAARPAVL